MAGYSGTPLAKKLGLKDGTRLYAAGAPRNYLKGVRLSRRMDDKTDITEGTIREIETWSGLKLVIRKELRK